VRQEEDRVKWVGWMVKIEEFAEVSGQGLLQ